MQRREGQLIRAEVFDKVGVFAEIGFYAELFHDDFTDPRLVSVWPTAWGVVCVCDRIVIQERRANQSIF